MRLSKAALALVAALPLGGCYVATTPVYHPYPAVVHHRPPPVVYYRPVPPPMYYGPYRYHVPYGYHYGPRW